MSNRHTGNSNYVTNSASNLYAVNDINLTSNSDLTIKGSNVYPESGRDRLWSDNVASIIGANSVVINAENNKC